MGFVSFAQNFEDVILWRALGNIQNGFYIDVGANDPAVDSVTKAFYDRGWSGINIEPIRVHYRDLLKSRPRDINLNLAVGAHIGWVDIYDTDTRGWATVDSRSAEVLRSAGVNGRVYKVQLTTLTELCKLYAQEDIHFLKIDVEGYEGAVLAGMDLKVFRPWVLVIESRGPENSDRNNDWERDLLLYNYKLVYSDGLNSFYLAKEHEELELAFKYPPNVFDDFCIADHLKAHEAAQESNNILAALRYIDSSPLRGAIFKLICLDKYKYIKSLLIKFDEKTNQTIAIDLTPILPGAENGGAKPFVIALVSEMARLAPEIKFVLLTQDSSHQELASLDQENVRRLLVCNRIQKRFLLSRIFNKLRRMLPGRLRRKFDAYLNLVSEFCAVKFNLGSHSSLLSGIKADLLFCPFTAPTYAEAGIPVVSTLYDLQYKTYPNFFTSEDVAHRDKTFKDACMRANKIASISEYSRQVAIGFGGLDEGKIKTIPIRLARNAPIASSGYEEFLSKKGLKRKQYLLYPANFWEHKNHEMLLLAFSLALERNIGEEVSLVFTGAPNNRAQRLRKIVKSMGLGDKVRFLDYLDRSDFLHLMEGAKGLIFPSLYEGFGMPVIEAMAMGVPVACSNSTSLPEVVGGAAILFDPKKPEEISSAMISLAQDDLLVSSLIALGSERSTEFMDTERMALEYLNLFDSAIVDNGSALELSGVFEDGWATDHITLFAHSVSNVAFEISFIGVEWLFSSEAEIRILFNGNPFGNVMRFNPRVDYIFNLQIQESGTYEFLIKPKFSADSISAGDNRKLTVMVEYCKIFNLNSKPHILFQKL